MFSKPAWLLLFLLAYWTFCIVIGVRSFQRHRAPEQFFMPAGGIGTWIFVFAATTGAFAGWTFTGQPGQILQDGFQYINASFFVITIPLAGALVLKRQWMLGRKYGYVTPGEMYCGYFGGEAIAVISVSIALLFAVPLLATLLGASGAILQTLSDGVISRDGGMWLLAGVLLLYTLVGGLHAVAQVSVVQGVLFAGGAVILAAGAASFAGGFAPLVQALAHLASSTVGGTGTTKGFGGGDYNGLFAIPGVIQFTAGLGREAPVGGPWTAIMGLSFVLSLMGVQCSPAFSVWGFASSTPRAFPIYQIWGSAFCVGLIMFIFAPLQGLSGLVLGANAAANQAHLSVAQILPVLSSGEHGALVVNTIAALQGDRIWLVGLLAVAAIAAMQATAATYLATTGNILSRDIYTRYFRPGANWEQQRAISRIAMLLICLAALLMASFAKEAVLVLRGLAVPCSFQLLPSLLGVLWLPWITRRAATAGLIAGLVVVVLTEPLGQALTGNALPWGRWPWTIHSGLWGMAANLTLCLAVCALARIDADRRAREVFHSFLNDRAWSMLKPPRLKSAAWILVLGWLFFAVGPGALLGNRLFGAPGGGYQAWLFGTPSIWAWQVFWWLLGVGLVWFLAVKMELSTATRHMLTVLGPASAIDDKAGDHGD
jgi:Na+/proline symporter